MKGDRAFSPPFKEKHDRRIGWGYSQARPARTPFETGELLIIDPEELEDRLDVQDAREAIGKHDRAERNRRNQSQWGTTHSLGRRDRSST